MDVFESHFSNITGNLYYDSETDTYEMFSNRGVSKHINYLTFQRLFKSMQGLKSPLIVESGIASAGTRSTYMFNEYVRKYGGRLWSVDINRDLVDNNAGNMCPATTLVHGDSVQFFNDWASENKKADVIYLDSYDLDFYNPDPSGMHGLAEYNALKTSIQKGTLMLVDDTPSTPYWIDNRDRLYKDMVSFYNQFGFLPGKGMYILNQVKNATTLLHNYQLLYRFVDSPV